MIHDTAPAPCPYKKNFAPPDKKPLLKSVIEPALHGASAMGRTEAVKALIAAGASLEVVDKKRRTPLHLAAEHGHAEVIKALLAAGASVEPLDEDQRDPLTTATHAGHSAARRALRAARDGGLHKRIGSFLQRIPAALARVFGRKPGSKANEEKSEP